MSQRALRLKEKDDLQKELSLYERDGILLKLNGQISDADTIARACRIAEDGTYMRDYIQNEKGEWTELSFDWIEE
ncbi:MAG: hypothetical protein Q4E89_04400 [Eubacteriales bacterium]|nr:hypothetical protein [Eubacteriales bacterium]